MSLESSIAGLVAIGGQNLSLPQQIAQVAQDKVTLLGTTFANTIAGMQTTFFVDYVNGLDTNAGTSVSPYKTIQKALSMTPYGGACEVRLKSNITLNAHVDLAGKLLILRSDGSTKWAVSHDRLLDATSTPNYRYPAAFLFRRGGGLVLDSITWNVPDISTWGAIAAAGVPGGLIAAMLEGWANVPVAVFNCAVVIPTTPFCALFQGNMMLTLHWLSNTLTGAVTSLSGRMLADQTNTAGVATTTLPGLQTNLTTI